MQENQNSELKEINAGVPQGSVLGPILYLLYTCDIPQAESVTIATFADDIACLAVGNTIEQATSRLQTACNQITEWSEKWKNHKDDLHH